MHFDVSTYIIFSSGYVITFRALEVVFLIILSGVPAAWFLLGFSHSPYCSWVSCCVFSWVFLWFLLLCLLKWNFCRMYMTKSHIYIQLFHIHFLNMSVEIRFICCLVVTYFTREHSFVMFFLRCWMIIFLQMIWLDNMGK